MAHCQTFYDWGRCRHIRKPLERENEMMQIEGSSTIRRELQGITGKVKEASTFHQRERVFLDYLSLLKRCYLEGYLGNFQDTSRFKLDGSISSESIREHPIIWKGHFFSSSGYSHGTSEYVLKLLRSGFFIYREELDAVNRLKPSGQPEIFSLPRAYFPLPGAIFYLQHCSPFNLSKRTGMINIGITTWETSHLPPGWDSILNEMDEIWVASHFNRECFIESGVKVPVRILPYGVNTSRFNPGVTPLPAVPDTGITLEEVRKSFCFMSIGAFYPYKGFDALVTAYVTEFSHREPVMLILKVYGYFASDNDTVHCFIQSLCEKLKIRRPPSIIIVESILQDSMPNFLQLADAYISSSRGEGFCLPLMESMAMGKIVLSVAFGGQMDYVSDKNAFLIDHKRVPVREGSHPYHTSGCWAEPDIDHLRHQMRWVFEHQDQARLRGEQAFRDIADGWTYDHAGRKMEGYLGELYDSLA
jgi:glycosyltransferase involved in cell wall biosynthesis